MPLPLPLHLHLPLPVTFCAFCIVVIYRCSRCLPLRLPAKNKNTYEVQKL